MTTTRLLHILVVALLLLQQQCACDERGRRILKRSTSQQSKKKEKQQKGRHIKGSKGGKKSSKKKDKHKGNNDVFEVEIVDFEADNALEEQVVLADDDGENSPIMTIDGNETIADYSNNTNTTLSIEESDDNEVDDSLIVVDGNETILDLNVTSNNESVSIISSNDQATAIDEVEDVSNDTNETVGNETDVLNTDPPISFGNETDGLNGTTVMDNADNPPMGEFDNATQSPTTSDDVNVATDQSPPDKDDIVVVVDPDGKPPPSKDDDSSPPFNRDDHIAVELPAFQMLYSMPLSNEEEEMALLRTTKLHLEGELKDIRPDGFAGLEMFQLLRREGETQVLVQSMAMVAFGGSAYFDSMIPKDRLAEETMLAFLGFNLTRYQASLREDAQLPVDHAQLYTIEGDMVAYANGEMHVLGDWPDEEEAMDSMISIWLYIVAIGVPSLVCLILCIGYCALKMKGIKYYRPEDEPPEHETWHTVYHDDF